MDNDKWVWADEEDPSPLSIPLLDAKLSPIVEWPDLQPAPPEAIVFEVPPGTPPSPPEAAPARAEVPSSPPVEAPAPPAAVATQKPHRGLAPSVMKAIVLHLEGKLEEAIREIQTGLRNGEPAVELYGAMGSLQLELER